MYEDDSNKDVNYGNVNNKDNNDDDNDNNNDNDDECDFVFPDILMRFPYVSCQLQSSSCKLWLSQFPQSYHLQ